MDVVNITELRFLTRVYHIITYSDVIERHSFQLVTSTDVPNRDANRFATSSEVMDTSKFRFTLLIPRLGNQVLARRLSHLSPTAPRSRSSSAFISPLSF